jgi:hypothetical protein
MGGLIGVGVGVLLSYLINRFSGIPVAISIPWSAGAVLISMLIGVISRPSAGAESSQNGSDQCAETGMKTLCEIRSQG